MEMDVEIELRIPTLTVKNEDGTTTRVDNTHVRFHKVVPVPKFPPPGTSIQMSAGRDLSFECTVARADWHEGKQRFVVACRFPRQRIFPHEYEAILNDPAWEKTELPA